MDLGRRDKVALVTGAGSGIGQALALGLVAEGGCLVATDRRAESVTETATTAQTMGCEVLGLPLAVTHYAMV